MNKRSILVGIAAGFSLGYAAFRAFEAVRDVRDPAPVLRRDAAAYGRTRRALGVTGIARSLAGTAAFTFGRGPDMLGRITRTPWTWLRPIAFVVTSQTIDTLLELPVDYVEGHVIERRYAMTEQTGTQWLTEHVKGTVISVLVSSALAGLFGATLRRFRRTWPLLACAGIFPLLVLANVVVPLFILPLFNKFEPLHGPLERRLRKLAARYGCGDADILRVDMSRQTKKANAYVTGIGRTHRIVVGDTLLANFAEDEIEFVVAHELGHYVSKDSWRMIFFSQIAATILLGCAFLATRKATLERPDDPRTLLEVYFWMAMLAQVGRPAIAAFSRSREWTADRFALEATLAPRTGAAAFRRLREQNLAEEEQPAWYEFLFSTHPSLKARIDALERAAR